MVEHGRQSAMLHQIFSHLINQNSFNRNLSFLKQIIVLKSFNSMLDIVKLMHTFLHTFYCNQNLVFWGYLPLLKSYLYEMKNLDKIRVNRLFLELATICLFILQNLKSLLISRTITLARLNYILFRSLCILPVMNLCQIFHKFRKHWILQSYIEQVIRMFPTQEWLLLSYSYFCFHCFLILKAPITTAADNIHKYFFVVFQRK